MPKAAGVLFEVDSESLGRSEAVANVPGPSRPAAHIKPGESSKATAERKRPAAAKRFSIGTVESVEIWKWANLSNQPSVWDEPNDTLYR